MCARACAMEFLRITGLALCGAVLGSAVSLLVAVTLLELPYSLPFAGEPKGGLAAWGRAPPPPLC